MTEMTKSRAGKYLTFAIGAEEYGLEILKVREIIGYMDITSVPQMPPDVKGVINLRGRVIPIIDLRLRFGMVEAEVTDQTCIIVVEVGCNTNKVTMGIVVDSVTEVLDIAEHQLGEPPQLGSGVNHNQILAMGKFGDSVKILLDIDKVLRPAELAAFSEQLIPFDM